MTVLPTGWQLEPVKNIAREGDFFDGDWVESKDQDPTGRVRLVQLADVGEGNFRDKSSRWLRDDQADGLGASYLEAGDLLIARMPDPMGRCCQMPTLPYRSITAVDVAVLRIGRADISPKFVMWALNSPAIRISITSLASGTTRQRVSRKNLGAIEVSVPPLAEQKRIVEILEEQFSRLDAALTSIRTVQEKVAAFRRSLLQAAFHGALAGDSAVSIPSDWNLLSLDEVSEVRLGRQRSPRNHSGPQMRPYLRAANVTWQGLDLTDVKEMNFSDEELRVLCLKSGDILVGEASGSPNEVGKAAVFQGEIENCCFQNTLLRVRPLSIDTRYLHYFLTGTAMSGAYARESRGVGISHLGRAKLASWPVPVAPAPEQRRIGEMLDEQFSRLDAALVVTNQLEARIVSERRSLLHAAFSGTLTAQWRETHNG